MSLLWLEKQGYIKVYYGDATRVSMNSYLPSAWQPKGKPIGLNVFGLLNHDHDFHAYTTKQSINSGLIVGFIDDFLKNAPKGIKVIVLDNAPTHRSEEFEDQLQRWQKQDLFIFFLPRYAPHLNIIETLWRKIKYEWLEQHTFKGSNDFFKALEFILLHIGTIFKINFVNPILSK